MPSYVEVEAAGPYVDVTVYGPYRTVPMEPKLARSVARELERAADAVEHPVSDDDAPGLHIVLSEQKDTKDKEGHCAE